MALVISQAAGFPHTECAGYDGGMSRSLLDDLDVFYGELTPARAMVYARLEGLENTDGLSLGGFVRGPRCFYSKTLPATFRLQDAGPGPSLLAKSLVPDPCYWSPETPNIYDVTVELRRGQDVIASEVRQMGFKPLGIAGRFFTWEGKPWVMRGVSIPSSAGFSIAPWREHSATLVGSGLPNEQLREASEKGVLYFDIGHANCTETEYLSEAKRLARYPSVAIANLCLPTENVRKLMPNIIATCISDLRGIAKQILQGILVYRPRQQIELEALTALNVPLLVFRPAAKMNHSIGQARAACDKLQAELAPIGQFAGYIV
jgi:hypothetical protein